MENINNIRVFHPSTANPNNLLNSYSVGLKICFVSQGQMKGVVVHYNPCYALHPKITKSDWWSLLASASSLEAVAGDLMKHVLLRAY